MEQVGECVPLKASELEKIVSFSKDNSIDFVVVGPEDPLAAGLVDLLNEAGIKAFGPSKAAAQIEASKAFAKDLMDRHSIPTSAYGEFTNPDDAKAYVREHGAPIVVKADGLAAGKGVTVAQTIEEAIFAIDEYMVDQVFGDAGTRVVVEEFLVGEEASIFALTDGDHILVLDSSQDHKPAYDGDTGPNTGGMGAYSPAPVVTPELFKEIEETVLRPCIHGMKADGNPYQGVLYAGLMIGENGAKVVEFNCRFGDPETQIVLPRMKSDLLPILFACAEGNLDEQNVEWDEGACVTVVMASGGYPKAYEKGITISGIGNAESLDGVNVFHAGTAIVDNELVTNGGRVLNVNAFGSTIPEAIERAYRAVEQISFDGAHYRTDIGQKALSHL
jgi:phosphoribosylamine--glycine ligase